MLRTFLAAIAALMLSGVANAQCPGGNCPRSRIAYRPAVVRTVARPVVRDTMISSEVSTVPEIVGVSRTPEPNAPATGIAEPVAVVSPPAIRHTVQRRTVRYARRRLFWRLWR